MRVIVSAEPFMGESRISQELAKGYTECFKDDAKVKILIAQLASLGFKEFLCPYDLRLIGLFNSLRNHIDLEVYPVILDASTRSRELQTSGMVGLAKREISNLVRCNISSDLVLAKLKGNTKTSANLVAILRLLLFNFKHLTGVARRDFKYLSLALASLELANFALFRPRTIFLHDQMTDLFLANANAEFFKLFSALAKVCKSNPGFLTNNPESLTLFLKKMLSGQAQYEIIPTDQSVSFDTRVAELTDISSAITPLRLEGTSP